MFAELLEGTRWLDDAVFYDRRSRDPSRRFAAVARRLRADRADVALLVPNSLSSAALAFAGGARRRVGFARHWRRFLLTDPLMPVRERGRIVPVSTAEHAMDLAAHIGVARQPLTLELVTTAADEALADAMLARLFPHGEADDGPLIVFNDNGAYGPAKSWGAERFAALGRHLVERLPRARVLVHCGPGDRDDARAIVRTAAHPASTAASLSAEPPPDCTSFFRAFGSVRALMPPAFPPTAPTLLRRSCEAAVSVLKSVNSTATEAASTSLASVTTSTFSTTAASVTTASVNSCCSGVSGCSTWMSSTNSSNSSTTSGAEEVMTRAFSSFGGSWTINAIESRTTM
jgi:hypothetical protein